jgi:hypothetical protein
MDTASISDELAEKMVESKSNNRMKLTQKVIGFIQHGSFALTSQERAREIMEDNFFGVEEAIKHFGVNPSKRELAAIAAVPFSEKTLIECKYTHVLVAVFPLSILDIRNRVDHKLFFCRQRKFNCTGSCLPEDSSDYYKMPFAKDRGKGKVSWYLVRKTPVPDSTEKTWEMQQDLFGWKEEAPSARVLIYTMIGHFLAGGRRVQRLFQYYPDVRCSDPTEPGWSVGVGRFNNGGVLMGIFSRNERSCLLGLASVRKP